jgi:hypothetical protein
MIGDPMGVLPTSAIDHSAVTRPRWSGSDASWTVEFPVVRNAILAASASTHAAIAIGRVGATATKPTASA